MKELDFQGSCWKLFFTFGCMSVLYWEYQKGKDCLGVFARVGVYALFPFEVLNTTEHIEMGPKC